ncbi:MAG: hypothetical protein ACW98D_18520 [Promethearchaeota archaeon]
MVLIPWDSNVSKHGIILGVLYEDDSPLNNVYTVLLSNGKTVSVETPEIHFCLNNKYIQFGHHLLNESMISLSSYHLYNDLRLDNN